MKKPEIRHIRTRLFWAFISMAALTLLILWLVQAGLMRNSYIRGKIKSVESIIMQVDHLDSTALTEIEEITGSGIFVFSDDGTMVYRSQAIPMMGMMQRYAQAMLPISDNVQVEMIKAGHTGINYAVLAYPLSEGGAIVSIFSLADSEEAARILRQQLWLISLVLVAFSLILSSLFSKRISRPIQTVTDAARRIAAGSGQIELEIQSNDEIGQLTQALNDLSLQLQQNDRLQKELIANVSHELKAPLSIIRGYAETVRDVSWPDDAKRTLHLNLIADETDRLGRIIRDILDYSRLQAGVSRMERTEFDIVTVLDKMISLHQQAAAVNHLEINVSGQSETIVFDRGRFEQICVNLLQNAIQHARIATTIEIRIQLVESDGPMNVCRMTISNQGKTLEAQELNRIWDRYHQANQLPERQSIGTGLGLAIVKSIMDQHHAGYGVSSHAGTTTFWLDFPVSQNPAFSQQSRFGPLS